MRIPFSSVFRVGPGGMQPLRQIHINGITMGPGASFGDGVSFGGVNLASLVGHDLEVEEQGGVLVIKGHY